MHTSPSPSVVRTCQVHADSRDVSARIRIFACVVSVLLALPGCSPDAVSPTDALGGDATFGLSAPRSVTNLRITSATASSVTLSWTQVDNGAGKPASYRVKYARPPLDWNTAAVGCTVTGTRVGSPASCTVSGLSSGVSYDFQLMSYRATSGVWTAAAYSNVASGATVAGTVGTVSDLSVTAVTDESLTIRWTEVDDGTGRPASYRVKYAGLPFTYSTATSGCDAEGAAIGSPRSCTIHGLRPSSRYRTQLMAYRLENGAWIGAEYSNITEATTAPAPHPGIWISRNEVLARPMSGADWEKLLADAGRDHGVAAISDQDSNHDVYTLAAALVCVRNGSFCDKAKAGVVAAIGTEAGARWLAVGRNLGAYVIAADLLDLRADGVAGSAGTRVEQWIQGWMTRQLEDNTEPVFRGFEPFHSGANAAAQEGFTYAAVAAYLRDRSALDFVWQGYRTFVCDGGAVDVMSIYMGPPVRDGWTHSDTAPCAVNPAGTTKVIPVGLPGAGTLRRLDGALVGDMRRGGVYQWQPTYTSYPWVGLEGLVPAAVILERAGYPALNAANRALMRTHEYLWYLRTDTGDERWFDGVRSRDIVHLVNVMYNKSFPINQTIGGGRTVGYTGWTHATW
jgi:hypothetical protein